MASIKDCELYVIKDLRTGQFRQPGNYQTDNIQSAAVYSARKREGTRRLNAFLSRPDLFEAIPVRLQRL